MDYSRGYANSLLTAQRIRENTHQANKSTARGLAARDEEETTQTYNDITAKYMAHIQGMFETSAPPVSKLEQYLAGLDGVDTLAGVESPSASSEGHVDNNFISKLIQSESSGDPKAIHKTKDGRIYGGLVQIGEARLKDYNKANKTNLDMAGMLADTKTQNKVINWHLNDLSKLADKLSKETGLDKTGLVAVGHLGGRTGMANFAATRGKYNPSDELGTSLYKYYTRFKN